MNHTRRVRAWLAVVALLGASSLRAQAGVQYASAPHGGEWAETIESARAKIDSLMRANNIPGLSIAVSVDGEIVWSEGFGWANVETQTAVSTTTRFRIGSVSKSLTSVGLALLVQQGKLDLDAPVQQYVPSFPEKAKGAITTRLLGGHLAGVRHYNGLEFLSTRRYPTVSEGLDIFEGDTLLTPPGTAYSYSSYGWNLISAVMEGASDEEFLAFMRDRVFRPAGMLHTVGDYADSIILGRTGYYQRANDGTIVNAPFVDNSYKWAGGGFLSTPEDLLVLSNALMNGDLLTQEATASLWTSQVTTGGDATGYGIGWRVGNIEEMHRLVSHGGGSIGGNSWLGLLPDDGVALAVTTNISGARYGRVPREILHSFLEKKHHGR